MKLNGIVKLINRNAVNHIFTCNVAIPWNGKEKNIPIPNFFVKCYVVSSGKGDDSIKTAEGDVFDSSVDIFSIDPIGVLPVDLPPPLNELNKFLTVGALNTSFTLIKGAQTFRITSQRKSSCGYYISKGELNV